ncbi:MAG: 3-deoxy-7-phosphoheptulonate synthase [Candidatus Cloacimonadaceae bacterium]|nr:3-deoxy-7-phosphoheptulonate synthase [Candidatus Cloacimonadaceae bacterium]
MQRRKISINGRVFGDDSFQVIAGPCTVESKESLFGIAEKLSALGITIIRGGAYKLRTSVHSFRGLGDIAIRYLREVADIYNMITVSEIIEVEKVDFMAEYVDIILVGTRNMQNYPLLERLGKIRNPIILKRGMASTIKEWLQAAEYIAESGNSDIILCERGIRTFEDYTRNTLDISAIPAVKELSEFPIIADPSHSTGKRELVKAMSWAAVAAGANGLMIETHECPEQSMCDARQAVDLETFEEIICPISKLREAICSEAQLEIFR